MEHVSIVNSFFLIFTGAAILASVVLYTRQPIILAYIVLGALIGPYGLNYVSDPNLLSEIAEIGIIFLLFLLGLDMQPKSLMHMVQKATLVAVASSFAFAALGYIVAIVFGYTTTEALIIGCAMMFSSTIIGIKLLPTTVLHHRHTGELVVGLLLLQDLIAIVVLLMLGGNADDSGESRIYELTKTMLTLPLLLWGVLFMVKHIIDRKSVV